MMIEITNWILQMTLDEFIETEMKKRGMSLREFAKLTDISPSAISKYLNSASERNVSIEFLVKLSRGTGIDLASIIAIVYPDDTEIDAQARIWGQRIAELSEEDQDAIDSFILGLRMKSLNNRDDS